MLRYVGGIALGGACGGGGLLSLTITLSLTQSLKHTYYQSSSENLLFVVVVIIKIKLIALIIFIVPFIRCTGDGRNEGVFPNLHIKLAFQFLHWIFQLFLLLLFFCFYFLLYLSISLSGIFILPFIVILPYMVLTLHLNVKIL